MRTQRIAEYDASLELSRHVFMEQAKSLQSIASSLDSSFSHAIELMLECRGKVVVCGMGKSGIIGRKIAATLASTGTSSFFVHPGEAYHGDLGMIGAQDLVLLISYSGETDEILKLLPYLRHIRARSVSLTGSPASTLATTTDVHLDVSVHREACPNNLAPTTSTTASLVMGDALAIALMKQRRFLPVDFARFHPGGSLGRKLLTRADEVMHSVPQFPMDSTLEEVVQAISEGGRGIGCVMDPDNRMVGVVTDGDLRRAFERYGPSHTHLSAERIMGRLPSVVAVETNLHECERMMRERELTALIVVDAENRPVGVIKSFDA